MGLRPRSSRSRLVQMRRSRSSLLEVGGVYLVVVAGLAWWMNQRSRSASAASVAASVRVIGRELQAALRAMPGPMLPGDPSARLRLKQLVSELTDESSSVQSIDVVKADGTIVASDDFDLVGTRVEPVTAALGAAGEYRLRVPQDALGEDAVYELFLPVVAEGEIEGYLRMSIVSAALVELFAYQRNQFLVSSALGLGALSVLALIMQQHFYRRGDAIADELKSLISGSVTLPPIHDRAFSRIFEETGRLVRQLREQDGSSYERMGEQVARLTRLHGALAHELKAPLHAMVLNLELLERALARVPPPAEGPEERPAIRYATVLKDEVARLQRAVEALGSEDERSRWERVDLGELIRSIADLVRPQASAVGVEVTAVVEPRALVMGFRDRLRQVLLNLANNAIDAMPGGGRLSFTLVGSAASWCVRVQDTGGGFPEEVLKRLEAGPVTTKETGSGVGLYLARAIVEAHGGQIRVASAAGDGAACEIELPRVKEQA